MAVYTILIEVDPDTLTFDYIDLSSDADASNLVLTPGDRVIWALDPSMPERTFQIDFGVNNPFTLGQSISFRGSSLVMSAAISLPSAYSRNRAFEYSVSLANGWHDDPKCMVVPEPPDPHSFSRLVETSTTTGIEWTDDTETAITLVPASSPEDPIIATVAQGATTATVIFQWAADRPDPQPFTVEFLDPPDGWPTTVISDNGSGIIVLALPPGPSTIFNIETTTPAAATEIGTDGSLQVVYP